MTSIAKAVAVDDGNKVPRTGMEEIGRPWTTC